MLLGGEGGRPARGGVSVGIPPASLIHRISCHGVVGVGGRYKERGEMREWEGKERESLGLVVE